MEMTKNIDGEKLFKDLLAENCDKAKGWSKAVEVKETSKKPYSAKIWNRPIEGSKIKMLR